MTEDGYLNTILLEFMNEDGYLNITLLEYMTEDIYLNITLPTVLCHILEQSYV
jgi:hypothetical protein